MKQCLPRPSSGQTLLASILRFSIPLMLTGILQLAYNTADSVIVGRYAGSNSLAAVGSTTSIVFLLVTLFNGVAVGANFLAARDYGAGDEEALSKTVHCAALLSVILGVLAGVCGFFLSPPLLRLAGAPEEVLSLSTIYLRIYFLGVPAMVVYNFGSSLLRAVGDTVRRCSYGDLRCFECGAEPAVCGGIRHGRGRRGHCHLLVPGGLRHPGHRAALHLP